MKRDVASPAEYLAAVPATQLPLLQHLRSLILQVAPQVQEGIRWGMLSYDDSGGLFALGAQKHYVGLYVMATQALQDMAAELEAIDHGKGCLRFKRLEAVPTPLILKLLVHATGIRERECRKLS